MSNEIETIEAGGQYGRALALARLPAEHVNSIATSAADAKNEWSGAPIKLYVAMLTDYDDDVIESLPIVDSEGGNNPDKFEWKDPNSDAKPREVSFYSVWCDNTPEGQRILEEIRWLKALGDPEMRDDDIPEEYKKKYEASASREARRKYLTDRRGTVRNAYKKAVRLHHQIEAIKELAGVTCKLMRNADRTGYENFIHVITTNEERVSIDSLHLTVQQFLNLKAAKIAEQGGTFAALKASIVRKKKGEGAGGKGNDKGIPALASIQTGETLDKVLVSAHSYLDKLLSEKKGKEYGDFLKFLTGPGGASAVETLGDIRYCIDQFFKMDKVAYIYAKTKEESAERAVEENEKETEAA